MVSNKQRIKSLKGYPPLKIGRLNVDSRKFDVRFIAYFNAFEIVQERVKQPPILISYERLRSGKIHLPSTNDFLTKVLNSMLAFWKKMPKEDKTNIMDSMPLNSLYIGGDKAY